MKPPMLTGYRVLDITQFVAGPTCTRILAELGAEVIKVELAPHGDRGRASGDKPREVRFKSSSQSTYYFQHNHSKKSLAIDIKQPRGRELIRTLVPKVDVLVENFAPGVMGRAGLGYDELKARNRTGNAIRCRSCGQSVTYGLNVCPRCGQRLAAR